MYAGRTDLRAQHEEASHPVLLVDINFDFAWKNSVRFIISGGVVLLQSSRLYARHSMNSYRGFA